MTHNTIFRSRFAAYATWKESHDEFTNAGFEYDLDIGLMSFFRRYVFKDPNYEKSKRISFRLGYAYLPDLTAKDSDANEKRALGEVTFRFPLGKSSLLTDRNRGEIRRFANSDYGRYRNRLRIERNILIKEIRMTPYANGEVYYDGKVGEWNQADATVGMEFPWYYKTILEFSYTNQFIRNAKDDQVVGITLQKHL